MKKILAASIAAVGMMGLAACSDTDDTTTQSVDPATQQDPATAPSTAPAEDPATGGGDAGGMGTGGTAQ